ncbi:DUF4652 domain-containing protein [Clostridium sp. YIM B02505]|uniref:DUF4652 domain-containing protein n=1 Tax=Clostridium yunnanense TaxID=2800325 RepID=A0ABS1ESY7_9CLOT|nr:DUF4652 domain-containing protein [Clostridium yunnanense]MBK1812499.1 DUF4652 domain-containing protein [Clostridium yunnanense]
MKCDSFEKKLDLYVENQLQKEMKKLMDEHVTECENCRKLYEEEKELDEMLSKSLSFEDVDFKSSRAEIIKSIDKDRYKKGYKNNIKYHIIRNKNKYAIAASFAFMLTSMAFLKDHINFSTTGSKSDKAMSVEYVDNSKADSIRKSSLSQHNNNTSSKVMNDTTDTVLDELDILTNNIFTYPVVDLSEIGVEKANEGLLKGKSKAKVSPSERYEAYIVGKGDNIDKEGPGFLAIKDNSSNSTKYYKVTTNSAKYDAPLYVEWNDDNTLFIIVGSAYGKTTHGGSLYALNIDKGNTVLIYGVYTPMEQVTSIKVEKNKVQMSLIKYNDSSMNSYITIKNTATFDVSQANGISNSLADSKEKDEEYKVLQNYNRLLFGDPSIKEADVLADDMNFIKPKGIRGKTYINGIVQISDKEFEDYFKPDEFKNIKIYGVEFLTENKKDSIYQLVVLGQESSTNLWKVARSNTLPQGHVGK